MSPYRYRPKDYNNSIDRLIENGYKEKLNVELVDIEKRDNIDYLAIFPKEGYIRQVTIEANEKYKSIGVTPHTGYTWAKELKLSGIQKRKRSSRSIVVTDKQGRKKEYSSTNDFHLFLKAIMNREINKNKIYQVCGSSNRKIFGYSVEYK